MTKDKIDDNATYVVKMKRKLERDGVWLIPGRRIKLLGAVVKELGDAVDVAEPAG
jgi:hypothetical protein